MAEDKDKAPYVTKTGRVLTDEDFQRLADEAEAGYNVDGLVERNRDAKPEAGITSDEYVDFEVCLADGTHFKDVDEDGYCNRCGYDAAEDGS